MTLTSCFNVTFTRADESHAHVYESGTLTMAETPAQAWLQMGYKLGERPDLHYTKVELFKVVNDFGEVVDSRSL